MSQDTLIEICVSLSIVTHTGIDALLSMPLTMLGRIAAAVNKLKGE